MRREANGDQAKPGARRDVVGIGGDGLQKLQIVADAQVQRQARADLPLILRVEADIRIGLRDDGIAEGLRETRSCCRCRCRKLASDENE